jgi:hypothetical protein
VSMGAERGKGKRTHPLLVRLSIVVAKVGPCLSDVVGSGWSEDWLNGRFGVLNVLLDESDRENLRVLRLLLPSLLRHRRRHTTMQQRVVLLERRSVRIRRRCWLFRSDAEVLFESVDRWCALLETGLDVSVHAEDVLGDLTVSLLVCVVGDDEEQVETGEESGRAMFLCGSLWTSYWP